jgi:hypothetical protein
MIRPVRSELLREPERKRRQAAALQGGCRRRSRGREARAARYRRPSPRPSSSASRALLVRWSRTLPQTASQRLRTESSEMKQ